jgi:hypothetical protein
VFDCMYVCSNRGAKAHLSLVGNFEPKSCKIERFMIDEMI